MPRTFLTREEVAELTGTKLRKRQIEVLHAGKARHVINASGWRKGRSSPL